MKAIKNIIFDLGGVLIHLNLNKTEEALKALLGDEEAHSEEALLLRNSSIFVDLEVNAINEDDFLETIQNYGRNTVSKTQIEIAWNAMLLTFPVQGLNLIRDLRAAGYRLFVLSNTNSIHIRAFREILQKEHGINDFDALFDKAYYSHLVGLRKPNEAIFQHVLDDQQIEAKETLFIDDNAPNLAGAAKVGIQGLLLEMNGNVDKAVRDYLKF
ncbi:HAD family phosphatase [Aureispira]|nr:HAD family phosphatase [Aureispira sp.]